MMVSSALFLALSMCFFRVSSFVSVVLDPRGSAGGVVDMSKSGTGLCVGKLRALYVCVSTAGRAGRRTRLPLRGGPGGECLLFTFIYLFTCLPINLFICMGFNQPVSIRPLSPLC